VASGRTIGLSVGEPSTAAQVIRLMRRIEGERAGLPLVLVTDNGSAYCSAEVEAWLARRRVLHLRSLPRTPQHNPWAEHGVGELKREACLGLRGCGDKPRRKGGVVDPASCLAELRAARDRLDDHRPRRSRGWRTARETDRDLPRWSTWTTREKLRARVACAIDEALQGSLRGRARLRSVREALLGALEDEQLISRTIGSGASSYNRVEGVS